MNKYWDGTETDSKAACQSVKKLLGNDTLLTHLVSVIDSNGGFDIVCQKMKLTAVADKMPKWCNDHSDQAIKDLAHVFSHNSRGNIVKEVFIFRTSSIATTRIRYRTERATLVDSNGVEHKMFSLTKAEDISRKNMVYTVGQETDDDTPCTMVRHDDGTLWVYWNDMKIVDTHISVILNIQTLNLVIFQESDILILV